MNVLIKFFGLFLFVTLQSISLYAQAPTKIKPIKIKKCSCSGEYLEYKCENSIDRNTKTDWNSGGFAPQSILLELKKPSTIEEIRWINQMNPNGMVSIQFKFYSKSNELIEVLNNSFQCVNGETSLTTCHIENVKLIEITVSKSPSWIAFYEITPIGKSQSD